MATVYQFRVWDHEAGDMKTQPLKATNKWIERIGGEIMPNTGQDVPDDEIDAEGRHRPPTGGGAFGEGSFGESAFGEAFDRNAFQAPDNAGPSVPDAPFPATEPPNDVSFASAPIETQGVPTEAIAGQEAVQTQAEYRRRQQAAIAAATSGATDPLSPLPAGNAAISIPEQQPTAGTVPVFAFNREGQGLDEGQWAAQPDRGQANTAPTMADLTLSGSVATGDTQRGDQVARVVVASFNEHRDAIAISVATFRSLLEVRAEQLAEAKQQKNDPDAIAEIDYELAEIEAQRRRASEVQRATVEFEGDPAKQEAAVAASISFVQGIKNWWTEKHVSICDSSFKTSLFLAGAGVSYALGIPMLGAGVCGVLTGGEPVAKVLQAMFAKDKN